MKKGTVKWFDTKKGFGFIQSEEGADLFVHYSDIQAEGFRNLTEGENVTFDVKKSPKGEQAINVSKA